MTDQTCRVPAKTSFFEELRKFIDDFCRSWTVSAADRHKLTLIVEELFTNTVRHGHGGDNDAPVEISLALDADKIRLVYQDTAPRYDSVAAAMRTDIESTINERRIGGLGMVLTFALADSAQYAYLENRNRLVITLPRSQY